MDCTSGGTGGYSWEGRKGENIIGGGRRSTVKGKRKSGELRTAGRAKDIIKTY